MWKRALGKSNENAFGKEEHAKECPAEVWMDPGQPLELSVQS